MIKNPELTPPPESFTMTILQLDTPDMIQEYFALKDRVDAKDQKSVGGYKDSLEWIELTPI